MALPNVTNDEMVFWEKAFLIALRDAAEDTSLALGSDISAWTEAAGKVADQAVIQRRLRLAKATRLAKRLAKKHAQPIS